MTATGSQREAVARLGEPLRERLAGAGYDLVGIERTLSAGAEVLDLRPDAREPLPTLVSLFTLGRSVGHGAAAAALAPVGLDELGSAGLIEATEDAVRPLVRLDELDGLILASDPAGPAAADHVACVGPATRTLVRLTVRRPATTALDLGTGSGAHALLAARNSEAVIGTDVSPRALRYAALNAALNGDADVDWRRGDLFEPVDDQRFDLIVSNPPFVVSPAGALVYRDGRGRDEISEAVVRGAAARLRRGGHATLLCSWVCEPAGAWADAPRRWLDDCARDGCGCDAWVLRFRLDDAAAYAAAWARQHAADAGEIRRTVQAWLDHYPRAGIEQVASGAIVLRRRDGRPWFRADEARGLGDGAAAQLAAALDAGAFLAEHGREALLAERLRLAEGARLLQRCDVRQGRLALERVRLVPGDRLRVELPLPHRAGPLLERLDGRLCLADALEAAATATGASPEALAGACLPAVAELLAVGLLERYGLTR